MVMENSTKGILKKWHALVAIFFLAAFATNVQAQNVTIGPDNGSIITGQAGANADDSGILRGMGSMWRHEQLPLTMTTSDVALLTGAGELQDPSCAIDVYNGKLIIGAGQTQTFMVVSLPKGYRITGYTLVLQPNVYGNGIRLHEGKDCWNIGSDDQMSFYETPAWSSGSPYGDNTHSTQLTCSDAIATAHEVGNVSNTVMQNDSEENRAKEFVISRTSQTETYMTNQLHFFFARATSQYAVTIKSFEIRFTAEGTFNADVTPVKAGEATDYVTSPFSTSKMDVGVIVEKNGLYTYDYTKVRDLIAYTHLYQDNAISGGIPSHKADGEKNIYPVEVDGKDAYAFGNDTYFIEPPISMNTASGIKDQPIGFRVVGATFDYKWGTKTEETTKTVPSQCQITCRGSGSGNPSSLSANGGTTFYLNSSLMFTSTPFSWEVDDLGNIGLGFETEYPQFLSCSGEGSTRQLSLGSSANGDEARWNLRRASDGSIYYYSDGGNSYRLYAARFQEGTPYHTRGLLTTGNLPNNQCVWVSSTVSENVEITLPAFTPGEYTLTVYGTDKDTPIQTIKVRSAADAGTYTTPKLNNDAVKFEISGLPDGCQALVNVKLQMEALNPYINKMDIVCESEEDPDTHKKLELIQTFTANDFAVSGGKFIFYIPTDYYHHELTFTFNDLYSQYGDESYGGTGNARYSYVTSPYFQAFDGYAGNAIIKPENPGYDMNDATDAGLYDDRYNPDAASTHKIYTSVAGNIRFKFNNAEDITGSSGEGQYLKEYPFSVTDYLGSADPDGDPNKTGEFKIIKMNASREDQKSGIYFVFTADETRYNIAPTTAWEHRSYAFYRMDIDLVAKNYIPSLEWTKLYDVTCYADQDESGKDIEANKAMWGLKVTAKDKNTAGGYIDVESGGYLSMKEIMDALNGVESQECVVVAPDGVPESRDQVLYVDFSDMMSIVSSAGYDLATLKQQLAPNSLVYLPENTTSTADNFAYKTTSGSFLAGRNIVLTDRKPFYAPYDIQVQAAPNNITYTRDITWQTNGQVTNASVIVPFEIAVDANGLHNDGEGNEFIVHQIQADGECISDNPQSDDDYIHVLPLAGMKKTEPNVPYVVKVEKLASAAGSTASFVVKQTGALLKATTDMDDNYEFSGTAGTGKSSVTFTPTGSFSGKLLAKASNSVYYFAHNMFLDIKTLNRANLYVYPFRAYFRTTGGTGAKGLNIFYGENFDTTGINSVEEDQPVMVDPNAPVYDVYGRMVANTVREIAGKKLPRGIYVVKGIKFNVK